MSKTEEAAQRLLVEYRILEGSLQVMQSRFDIINAALNDLAVAYATVEGLREKQEGTETLIPVGAGSFIKTTLKDMNRIIMGVGSGVCVEKSVDDCLLEFKSRQSELEKAKATLEGNMGENVRQLEQRRQRLSELVERQRGASPGVVR